MPSSTPASPATALQLPCLITLHKFCDHYGINTIDEAKLEKLKYTPRDKNIEKLSHKDWQGFGGFGKPGWDKVVTYHKQFVWDMIACLWDVGLLPT